MERKEANHLAWALEHLFSCSDVRVRNVGTADEPVIMLTARVGGKLYLFRSVEEVRAALGQEDA